ncbi:MAG: peptidase M61 [Bacteroidia bacterium]|nr:peptidase M61 [Bacteroidia bacterium]
MKKLLILALSFFSSSSLCLAQNSYQFNIDLTQCINDKLSIELISPKIETESVIYRLPKIVPGTYEIYDFGRFVSNLNAFDSTNTALTVEQLDKNSWKINKATTLYKITYEIEDTWDTKQKEAFVFEPAGSNFETNKNFVLNPHCMIGFFDNMLKLPYKVSIKHPIGFYGACSLTDINSTNNTDTFSAADYYQLQDAPIMYNVPDTTSLLIGGAQILISVYSPTKVTNSKYIAEQIHETLIAQQKYLGGTLPIKKYVYLIYLTDKTSGSGSSGALEHSYSSMYFLPEMEAKYLAQTIKDVSAHEFFHIITPLTIHSEEIGDFDYSNPKMSKHLWLYEGVTEYAAGLVQVKYGNMSVDEYLELIDGKISAAKYYNDTLPFTTMSKNCLDIYEDQYANVYQKGALIGLCLDIQLRILSNGKYGVQELITDLSKKYGKDKSFKDDELFDEIVKLTYPEIADFIKRYIDGTEPLPLKELLEKAGFGFGKKSTEKDFSLGGISLGLNSETSNLVIVNTAKMDDFGKALGYEEFDELIKFNGKKINIENAQEVLGNYLYNAQEGQTLKVTVLRRVNEKNKSKKIQLKTKIFKVSEPDRFKLSPIKGPTQEQNLIRSAWLNK